jgi:hypothetical protein
MIRIEMKNDAVAVGERVAGQVVWSSQGGKQPRKIEVFCRWRLEGKQKAETLVDSATEEQIESRSQVVLPFDFEVPFVDPVSYDGKLFRIIWEIVATADLPFAKDEVETKVITVTPAAWTAEEYRQWHEEDLDDEDEEDEEAPP